MKQLFLDLDGVLADFDGHYGRLFGTKPDRNLPEPKDFWKNLSKVRTFFLDLPPLPDALDLWHGAKALHPNPIILTGVPTSLRSAGADKQAWVAKYISPEATVITTRARDKRLHGKPGDILVDDWKKYQHLWEEMGGTFVLHTSAAASLAEVTSLLRGR